MTSDYKKITSDNIRRRGTDFDDIGQWLAEQLYSERTHFIYELLQNAEDALARRMKYHLDSKLPKTVTFLLYKDRLEFRHFGIPFNTNDVKAISDILKGTKTDERSQIGRFGIGFKSVYAFTSTPIIHSGNEHFVIERYIRPRFRKKTPRIKKGETVFVLPFNHAKVSAETAFSEISNKLEKLGPRILLFLKHIDEIEWKIMDQDAGLYMKNKKSRGAAFEINVIGQKKGENIEEERWLLFERKILQNKVDDIAVEIAFQMEDSSGENNDNIVKIYESPLVVYFPTEKETNLGFLIQGPYRTTPARDNILKYDSWNAKLIKETAFLIGDSLESLKQMDLLTVNVLETMPIQQEYFPEGDLFHPIFSYGASILSEQSLLPTDGKDYVSGNKAKLARGAELRSLVKSNQLRTLCNEKAIRWLSEDITQNNTPELRNYLMEVLNIEEISAEGFARKITKQFIELQTDEWMTRFYNYLANHESLWEKVYTYYRGWVRGLLRDRPIIRLENDKHIEPFRSDGRPKAYLPSMIKGTKLSKKYPIIKDIIARSQKAQVLFEKMGITTIGQREEIEHILNSYYRDNSPDPTNKAHLIHIKTFISWYKETNSIALFEGYHVLREQNKNCYYKPDFCYLDQPFKNTGLSALYCIECEQEVEKVPLWHGYLKIDGFIGFAQALGVQRVLPIYKVSTQNNPDCYTLRKDYYRSRVRWTNTAINEDYTINNLMVIITKSNIPLSSLIWKTMSRAPSYVLRARFRPNQQHETRVAPSQLVFILKEASWIPDKNGVFHKPSETTRESLQENFRFNDSNGWLTAIGFGAEARKKLDVVKKKQSFAKELGLTLDEVDFMTDLKEYPDLYQQFKNKMTAKKYSPDFPERESRNRERRNRKITEHIRKSIRVAFATRSRSVRTTKPDISPQLWLKDQYENDEKEMVCQICKEVMPFKKRNGDYYFESVEVYREAGVEFEELYLALCPVCAAMYKEFVKRDQHEMKKFLTNLKESSEPEIPLQLGEKSTSVRFVQLHLDDLKHTIKQLEFDDLEAEFEN